MWHGEEPRWMLPLIWISLSWIVIMRVIANSGMRGRNLNSDQLVPHYPVCFAIRPPVWRHSGWVGAAAFDLLIYGLTVYRIRELSRSLSRNSAALFQLRSFIWTSSTLYFAAAFCCDLACALTLQLHRNAILPSIPFFISQFCNTVIACRIVFHSDLFSEGKTGLLVIDPRYREASRARHDDRKQPSSHGHATGANGPKLSPAPGSADMMGKAAFYHTRYDPVDSPLAMHDDTELATLPGRQSGGDMPFELRAEQIFPGLYRQRSRSEDAARELRDEPAPRYTGLDDMQEESMFWPAHATEQEVLADDTNQAMSVSRPESALLRYHSGAVRRNNSSSTSAHMTQETTVEVECTSEDPLVYLSSRQ